MNHVNSFKDLFESIPDYWMNVLLMFLVKKDVDLLNECGFLKNDVSSFCLEFEEILLEQNEDYLNYVKNEEEAIIGKFLKKLECFTIFGIFNQWNKNNGTIIYCSAWR